MEDPQSNQVFITTINFLIDSKFKTDIVIANNKPCNTLIFYCLACYVYKNTLNKSVRGQTVLSTMKTNTGEKHRIIAHNFFSELHKKYSIIPIYTSKCFENDLNYFVGKFKGKTTYFFLEEYRNEMIELIKRERELNGNNNKVFRGCEMEIEINKNNINVHLTVYIIRIDQPNISDIIERLKIESESQ